MYTKFFTATTRSSLAHGHTVSDGSNFKLFYRREQFVRLAQSGEPPTQEQVDQLCAALPDRADATWLFEDASLAQFVGSAVVNTFIKIYNGPKGVGTGLFKGMERYRMLTTRLQPAAVMAQGNLLKMWSILTGKLVGVENLPPEKWDSYLFRLLKIPAVLSYLVCAEIAKHAGVIVMLGREWHQQTKYQSKDYIAALESEDIYIPLGNQESAVLSFKTLTEDDEQGIILPVPAMSTTALRSHYRKAATRHLLHRLELDFDTLPRGVRALGWNGGSVEQGSKARSNEPKLNTLARQAYPNLALFGGCARTIMGESELQVFGSLICRENNVDWAGDQYPPEWQSNTSAFDMIAPTKNFRHVNRLPDESPNIYERETLAKGARIAIMLRLRPWATRLHVGALVAMVEQYVEDDSTFGGQSASGHGLLDLQREWTPDDNECLQEYEAYLQERKDELREGLLTGRLCVPLKDGEVMCS